MREPLPLQRWIDEHRHLLKPPVGNKLIFEDSEFIVMAVGGPNARSDYHLNESEELFFMVEGDMILRVMEGGGARDIPIREGEIFLLPPNVPHSPIRSADTVGLVVERQRRPGEMDGLRWYCSSCGEILHEEYFALDDIVAQLRDIIERFYADRGLRTCRSCGHVLEPPKTGAPIHTEQPEGS